MRGRSVGPGGGTEGAMAWPVELPVADLLSLWVEVVSAAFLAAPAVCPVLAPVWAAALAAALSGVSGVDVFWASRGDARRPDARRRRFASRRGDVRCRQADSAQHWILPREHMSAMVWDRSGGGKC